MKLHKAEPIYPLTTVGEVKNLVTLRDWIISEGLRVGLYYTYRRDGRRYYVTFYALCCNQNEIYPHALREVATVKASNYYEPSDEYHRAYWLYPSEGGLLMPLRPIKDGELAEWLKEKAKAMLKTHGYKF